MGTFTLPLLDTSESCNLTQHPERSLSTRGSPPAERRMGGQGHCSEPALVDARMRRTIPAAPELTHGADRGKFDDAS